MRQFGSPTRQFRSMMGRFRSPTGRISRVYINIDEFLGFVFSNVVSFYVILG